MSTVLFDSVKTMSRMTDSVLVSFSGGKDSIVVLDLCMRYFKNVKVLFGYCVPDLSYEERILKWYENHYQTEIDRWPCWAISEEIRYGGFTIGDRRCPVVSQTDWYNYFRSKYGIWYVAVGDRINDSLMRRAKIKHSSSIDYENGILYPISGWRDKEIWDYIKRKKLYLSPEQRIRKHSVTIYGPNDLTYIKEHIPEDYHKILHIFPMAGSIVKRNEMILAKKAAEKK